MKNLDREDREYREFININTLITVSSFCMGLMLGELFCDLFKIITKLI